jgi:hypothetical protein
MSARKRVAHPSLRLHDDLIAASRSNLFTEAERRVAEKAAEALVTAWKSAAPHLVHELAMREPNSKAVTAFLARRGLEPFGE